jgi:hypothetical protein
MSVPLPAASAGAHLHLQVLAEPSFVPAELGVGSDDRRQLAFLLESAHLA